MRILVKRSDLYTTSENSERPKKRQRLSNAERTYQLNNLRNRCRKFIDEEVSVTLI